MMPTYYKVGLLQEVSYGVIPASSMQLVNVQSLRLSGERDAQRPNVLTGSRRPHPTRILSKNGAITLPMPLQYENDLIPMRSVMCSDRGSAITIGPITTVSFTSGTNKIEDSADGFTLLASGDMIYVTGAGAGTNANKWFGPIVKVDNGDLTLPPGQVATQAAGGSVTIRTRRWLDGDTEFSFSLQWQATQLTNKYRRNSGNVCGSARFAWEQGSYATVEFTGMGQYPSYQTATMGTGGDTAAPTSAFMNSVDDFQQVRLLDATGTAIPNAIVSRLNWEIASNRPAIRGLGDVGPTKFDMGVVNANVEGVAIYDNNSHAIAAAVEAHDTMTVLWEMLDPQGNKICYVLPAVEPDTGEPEIGEADSNPSTLPFRFTAHDPAKDVASFFNGDFSYVVGVFMVPGP